jgi:hypothetical protein
VREPALASAGGLRDGALDTQFTSFTSTKVQILTPEALCSICCQTASPRLLSTGFTTQFTYFAGTKVQKQTSAALRCSHFTSFFTYSLY